jgi:hypothetical protein
MTTGSLVHRPIMQRIAWVAGAMLVALLVFVPVAFAADPSPGTDHVLISVNGDVDVPAGDHADTVFVVRGTATIEGDVGTVVAINGAATFTGASAETVVAIDSTVTLGPGSIVSGDVRTINSTVEQVDTAAVQGDVRDLSFELVAIGAVLAPALILFAIGFALAAMVAGLALAGVAARQVRSAEALITKEPGPTLVAGLVGLVVPPIVAIAAMVTIIGAPLGLGILFGLWPLMALLGYLVAGIWIGDWILRRVSPNVTRERPYLASVVGILVLQVIAILPPAAAIASLFGFGAVILLAWRAFRRHDSGTQAIPQQPSPVPMGA